jgi:hypothetical protein
MFPYLLITHFLNVIIAAYVIFPPVLIKEIHQDKEGSTRNWRIRGPF